MGDAYEMAPRTTHTGKRQIVDALHPEEEDSKPAARANISMVGQDDEGSAELTGEWDATHPFGGETGSIELGSLSYHLSTDDNNNNNSDL